MRALLPALLLLSACASAPPQEASIGPLVEAMAGLSCRQVVDLRARITGVIAGAYGHNRGIEGGQKAAVMVALVPVVGLVGAGGALAAGAAKLDTRGLRVLSDRAQDEINRRLMAGRCGLAMEARGE